MSHANLDASQHVSVMMCEQACGTSRPTTARGSLDCACPSAGRHVDFGANMCVASDANAYPICDVASVANAYPICDVASDAKRIPHLRRGYSRKRIPHLRRGFKLALVELCFFDFSFGANFAIWCSRYAGVGHRIGRVMLCLMFRLAPIL